MTRSRTSDPTQNTPVLAPKALQQRSDSVFSANPDAMIVIDDKGRITEFSKAAEALFGHESVAIIGQNVGVLMTTRDRSAHDNHIARYLKTHKRRVIGIGRVVTALRADGTEFPIDLRVGEARVGERSVFTGFVRDLTDQKQAEDRMRQMQAELVHFSRLSAVATMASAFAHELNQPLTAITNYVETARNLMGATHESSEALDGAAKQIKHARQIVRKLKDFVAHGEVVTRRVALTPLLEDAITLASVGAGNERVCVETHFDPDLPDVEVDPVQIQQVVVNLLKNAFEAMAGQQDASVRVETLARPKNTARIRIMDNGPGIEPNIVGQLFRPFTSSKADGMGLGLSICQTIIEAHGSHIVALPDVQDGACFEFSLPCSKPGGSDD